jgi:hypothetical protein
MNWGKGITIFLVLFIAFITTLAVILMRTDSELVSDDYYIREVMYGQEITAEQNALNAKAELHTEISEAGVFIQVKQEVLPSEITVHLLRNNDPSKDVEEIAQGSSVFIESGSLNSGKYRLTVNYKIEEDVYQLKKEIWIP